MKNPQPIAPVTLAAIHGLFYGKKSGPAGATNTIRGLTISRLNKETSDGS